LSLNTAFFVAENPRCSVPLLQDAVRHCPFDFASVVTRAVLRIDWNGEVFSDMLLLSLERWEGLETEPTGRSCGSLLVALRIVG
jgi:hypothetical protein